MDGVMLIITLVNPNRRKKAMGEPSILTKLKRFIAGVAFKLFLWGNEMTQEVFGKIFKESPLKRAKLGGMKRNVEFLVND